MFLVALENHLIFNARNRNTSARLHGQVFRALQKHINLDIFLLDLAVENIFVSFNLAELTALAPHHALQLQDTNKIEFIFDFL